jgi:hypothetical protein
MPCAGLLLVLALAALVTVGASGFGARFGAWDFRVGFVLLRWGAWAGLVLFGLVIAALLVPRLRARRAAWLGVALATSAVAALPLYWMQDARRLPPINDITTDTANPPEFKAVVPLRAGSPVPVEYPGEATAKQQLAAYPELRPALLASSAPAAFDAALATARRIGWDIVAIDPAAGRFEATATTPWFGFKDDIVVRVTPRESGSRVDVRSLSRVGRGDLGANARRIREYVAMLTM